MRYRLNGRNERTNTKNQEPRMNEKKRLDEQGIRHVVCLYVYPHYFSSFSHHHHHRQMRPFVLCERRVCHIEPQITNSFFLLVWSILTYLDVGPLANTYTVHLLKHRNCIRRLGVIHVYFNSFCRAKIRSSVGFRGIYSCVTFAPPPTPPLFPLAPLRPSLSLSLGQLLRLHSL